MRRLSALLCAPLVAITLVGCGASGGDGADKTPTTKAGGGSTTTSADDTTTTDDGASTTTIVDEPVSPSIPTSTTEPDGTTTDPEQTTTTDATTTTTGGSGGKTGSEDDYVAALVKGFTAGNENDLVLPADGARCVAPKWIDAIGVSRLVDKKVSPEDMADPDFGFNELGLDRGQATAMIDAFGPCDVDIYQLLLDAIGSEVGDDKRACLRKELTAKTARDLLIGALLSSDQNTDPVLAELERIDKVCKLSK